MARLPCRYRYRYVRLLPHNVAVGESLTIYLTLVDRVGGRGDQPVDDDELAVAIGQEFAGVISDPSQVADKRLYNATIVTLVSYLEKSYRPDLAPRVAAMPMSFVLQSLGDANAGYADFLADFTRRYSGRAARRRGEKGGSFWRKEDAATIRRWRDQAEQLRAAAEQLRRSEPRAARPTVRPPVVANLVLGVARDRQPRVAPGRRSRAKLRAGPARPSDAEPPDVVSPRWAR
jgi:hypothetical protein